MKIEDDWLLFANGSAAHANNGIVGLGPDGRLYGGYDDVLDWEPAIAEDPRNVVELADHMIEAWKRKRDEAIEEIAEIVRRETRKKGVTT